MAMKPSCSVESCDRESSVRGLCPSHYARFKRTGDVQADVPFPTRYKACRFDGCTEKVYGHGWCRFHYRHIRNGQEPRADRLRAPKGSGYVQQGYRMIWSDGRKRLEHRVVMEQVLGRPLLDGENVHHINGDKLDNRPENLELWIISQPCGQRVEDMLAWAREIIDRYGEPAQLTLLRDESAA